jgi:hypothetical protein
MQPAGPPSSGILKKKAVEQASAAKTRSQRQQENLRVYYDELDFSDPES